MSQSGRGRSGQVGADTGCVGQAGPGGAGQVSMGQVTVVAPGSDLDPSTYFRRNARRSRDLRETNYNKNEKNDSKVPRKPLSNPSL